MNFMEMPFKVIELNSFASVYRILKAEYAVIRAYCEIMEKYYLKPAII
jgi:hypothetical protein